MIELMVNSNTFLALQRLVLALDPIAMKCFLYTFEEWLAYI